MSVAIGRDGLRGGGLRGVGLGRLCWVEWGLVRSGGCRGGRGRRGRLWRWWSLRWSGRMGVLGGETGEVLVDAGDVGEGGAYHVVMLMLDDL